LPAVVFDPRFARVFFAGVAVVASVVVSVAAAAFDFRDWRAFLAGAATSATSADVSSDSWVISSAMVNSFV
jgi:hypothetical protein